jgi:hypothetical protein
MGLRRLARQGRRCIHVVSYAAWGAGDHTLLAGCGSVTGRFLQPGDRVRIWVENVGELTTEFTSRVSGEYLFHTVSGLTATDAATLCAIDRELAVFGADYDQRGIEESLRAHLSHNLTERLVHEVEPIKKSCARNI